MNIKKGKFDRYRCLICFEGRSLEKKINLDAEEKTKVSKYKNHLALVNHQNGAAKLDKLVVSTDPRKILCIFDYTTIHDLTTEKWRDMGVCVKHNGKTFFVDNFANQSHDHHMTTSSWDATLTKIESKGISLTKDIDQFLIWSDGGLKTKETLRYFQDLSTKFPVTVFSKFYSPYHGHSEADGHFGIGKMTMRRKADNGPILSPEQVFDAFSSLKETMVQMIDVQKKKQEVLPLDCKIRKWFEFKFQEGRCWAREKCGEGEWTENTIWLREEKEFEEEEKAREARQDKEEEENEKQRAKEEKEKEKQRAKEEKEKEKQRGKEERQRTKKK